MPPINMIKITGFCTCGNNDPAKYRCYIRKRDDKRIGKICIECQKEWLIPEYITSQNSHVPDSENPHDPDTLLENKPIEPEVCSSFQVQCGKTKVDLKYFAYQLTVGDHVTWHRPYLIWHHAIVIGINAEKGTIQVIEWNKNKANDNRLEIFESEVLMTESNDSLFNQMYVINYPKEITKVNLPELVEARATSRKGDAGYGPFNDNCESFATYCKTGCALSHQISWLSRKFKECSAIPAVTSFIEVLISEGIEYLVRTCRNVKNGSKWVVTWLSEFLESSYAKVGQGVSQLRELFESVYAKVAQWVPPWLTELFECLYAKGRRGVSAGVSWLKELFESLYAKVGRGVSWLKEFVDNFYAKVGRGVSWLSEFFESVYAEVARWVPTWLSEFFESLCAKVSRCVPTWSSEFLESCVKVARRISTWLGEFFERKVGQNVVGALFVILIELILVYNDYCTYCTKREKDDISRREFIEELTRRIHEGIWSTSGAIASGIGFSLLVTSPLALFLVGVASGFVGGTAGRVFGTWFGGMFGEWLALRYT